MEEIRRTLYKLIQATLRGENLREMVGYDLSGIIMNFDYDNIGKKNRVLLDDFFERFIDEMPQVLVINPKIPDHELEDFSIRWNELLIKRGAEFQTPITESDTQKNVLALLLVDCNKYISKGKSSLEQMQLLERIDKILVKK